MTKEIIGIPIARQLILSIVHSVKYVIKKAKCFLHDFLHVRLMNARVIDK